MNYARITFADGRKIFLRVEHESSRLIVGIEVDREGDEIKPRAAHVHRRRHIIDRGALRAVEEMRMNLTYAMLEPADTPEGDPL